VLDDVAGALVEPTAVAVHAVRRANLGLGDRVLITGAGAIGLLTLQVALASGATEVVVTDINPSRLKHASRLGATAVHDVTDLEDGGAIDPDVVFECSGSPNALGFAARSVREGGMIVLVGIPQGAETQTPLAELQHSEINLTTSFRYAHAFPTAISLLASGKVLVNGLDTARFPLERADAALRVARDDPQQLKVIVEP
jgi:L-iditol 2-dehydrogenase